MPMTETEKSRFLRLFNRGGYVLNFATDSFDTFTKISVGVALCARYGLTKGKSLAAHVKKEGFLILRNRSEPRSSTTGVALPRN